MLDKNPPHDDPPAAAAVARPEEERYPLGTMFGYGLQHILAMFGGVIAVPIILGGAAGLSGSDISLLLACSLFVSGLATLLQTLGVPYFGSQLPLVQGISFASVSTLLTIIGNKGEEGLRIGYGAVIFAAVICLLITPFFAQIVRFFPPVVTGSIITVIGLSLMPVAAGWITGQETVAGKHNPDYLAGSSIALAMFTLVVILVLSKVPGMSRLSILLGLVIGTIASLVTGQSSFDPSGSAFAVPTPFAFGAPQFQAGAIASMLIVMLVIMVETTADVLAVGEVVGTTVTPRRIGDGLRADMAASAIAPVFNTFPATAFAQNVGLVAITGIKSRFVVACGGVVLAILGLSPWLASIASTIPQPVLGGAGIVLFGTVAASGIRTLSGVRFGGNNNLLIVAVAVGMGLLPELAEGFWSAWPTWAETILDSGISAAALAAVLLTIFFNMFLPGTPDEPSVLAAAPALMVCEDEAKILNEGGGFHAGDEVVVMRKQDADQLQRGEVRTDISGPSGSACGACRTVLRSLTAGLSCKPAAILVNYAHG